MKEILLTPQFLQVFFLVLACIVFGFFLRFKGIVGNEGKKVLRIVIWDFALPCMAFCAFVQDFDPADLRVGAGVLIGSFLFYLLFIFVGRGLFWKQGKDFATVTALMSAIGQLTLFTMPLVSAMGLDRVTFYCGIMTLSFRSILYFVACPMILSGKKQDGGSQIKKILLTPVMLAMMLGFLCWLLQDFTRVGEIRILRLDESLPAVYATLKTLSSLVCPLSMVMIGMILGESDPRESLADGRAWIASALRTFVFPMAVFALVSLLPNLFDASARIAMTLGFAAPSSVTICAFCVAAGKEETIASRVATLSVFLSMIGIPLFVLLTF